MLLLPDMPARLTDHELATTQGAARVTSRHVATIRTLPELEALYDEPVPSSLTKEIDHLTPLHRRYIDASPFVLVASAGPGGLDCSPRGDPAGFVHVADDRTLLLPDRRGNNRLDSLRNLVVDPRIGLLFLVPGVGVTLRVNGTAELRTDDEMRTSFELNGTTPTIVVKVSITSAYTQCPKALIRSKLWDPATFRTAADLPSVGQINELITDGEFDGAAYDAAYPERVRQTLY